jgi:hypothetical protein
MAVGTVNHSTARILSPWRGGASASRQLQQQKGRPYLNRLRLLGRSLDIVREQTGTILDTVGEPCSHSVHRVRVAVRTGEIGGQRGRGSRNSRYRPRSQ